MEKEIAKDFWNKIVNAIESSYSCGNEGNSGEFHDEDEAKGLGHTHRKNLKLLADSFEAHTGFRPVPIRPRRRNNYAEGWKLFRK